MDRRLGYITVASFTGVVLYVLLPTFLPSKKPQLHQYTKGLVNSGNDCFANSTFQALSSLQTLIRWLTDQSGNDELSVNLTHWMRATLEFLTKLQAEDLKSSDPVSIWPLLRVMEVRYGGRISRTQQDAHEMLVLTLELMETETNLQARTPATPPFVGKVRDVITCMKCHFSKHVESQFTVLEKQPNDPILQTPAELISDYRCDNCNNITTIQKSNQITHLPNILCVHINRSTYSGTSFRNNANANVPLLLPTGHSLKAIVFHRGNHHRGHYTCARKQKTRDNWWLISDDSVQEVSEKSVISRTSEAYLLFYELTHLGTYM